MVTGSTVTLSHRQCTKLHFQARLRSFCGRQKAALLSMWRLSFGMGRFAVREV